ncbi:MAG: IS200/IS605 family transposase, partial [Candidatus Marinimicrobia bacterium]|nr:IS200/IS605 family transposase [Candidatus Neomarinimicrobiota bacterium]
DRQGLMKKEFRTRLFSHIKAYAEENDIHLDSINGVSDHLHCFIGLQPAQSPAKVVNLLKGESSNWINKNDFLNVKLSWQDGYGVFSVSATQVPKVREYIRNQEKHHIKLSYQEEVERFLKAYGIQG